MGLVVLLGFTLAAATVGFCSVRAVRRDRTLSELKGDWWTRFERDFRAYASHVTDLAPGRQRRAADRWKTKADPDTTDPR